MSKITHVKSVYNKDRLQKIHEGFANDEAVKAAAQNPEKLDGIFGVTDACAHQHGRHFVGMAMDAGITQPVTTSQGGTPIQFLQSALPGVVNVITKIRKIDSLLPIVTAGEWHGEEVYLKTMEHTASPQLYSDHGALPLVNFQETYESRQIVRWELGAQHTKLADARSTATGTNPAAEKRSAVANAFEILRNEVGFYGFNEGNGKTYGWLNDPNLPSYVTVATGDAGSTWALKTAEEIVADIVTALNALSVQSGGNVDITSDPIALQIGLSVQAYMYKSDSSFSNGMTPKEWLEKNFSNVSIEVAPEFDGADEGENVFYLKAEKVADSGSDGGDAAYQVVPTKMMALGSAQNAKGGVTEGYTNALAGVMVPRPFAVYRASGI